MTPSYIEPQVLHRRLDELVAELVGQGRLSSLVAVDEVEAQHDDGSPITFVRVRFRVGESFRTVTLSRTQAEDFVAGHRRSEIETILISHLSE